MKSILFKDWRIGKKIGEGTFSEVYEANKIDGSISSIKYINLPKDINFVNNLIKNNFGKNYQEVNNYIYNVVKNEIEILKKFSDDSHFVKFFEVYEDRHQNGIDFYIRMEHVENLKNHFSKVVIDINEIKKIGIDICTALEKLSSINLIHGDIKPENIFIGIDGKYKLGDFSSIISCNSYNCNFFGSLNYISPELYKEKRSSVNSDVYSLGILMYQLVNGKLPFISDKIDEKTAFDMRMKGIELPVIPGVDKKIMDIILKACKFNINDRYKTPSEMLNDLKKVKHVKVKENNVIFSSNGKYEDTIDINDINLIRQSKIIGDRFNYGYRINYKLLIIIIICLLLVSALGTTYAFNRSCPVGHVNNNGFCVDGYYYCDDGYTLNEDNKCQKTLKSTDAKISYTCPSGYTMTDEEHCVSEKQVEMTKSYECIIDGTNLNNKTNKCEQLIDAQPSVTCPNNYVAVGKDCVTMSSIDATSSYGCQDSSYKLEGNKCKKNIVKDVTAEQKPVCDSGGTLKGNVCDYVTSPSYSWYRPSCTRGQYDVSDRMCHYTESPKYSYVCGTNGVYVGNGKCRQEVVDIQNVVIKYSCPSGYVVEGTLCFKSTNVKGTIKYSCSDGMQLRGSKCVVTTDAVEVMKCPDGYVTTGINCVEENIPTPVKKYSCSRAYTLNGDKCEKYDIVKAKKVLSDK